MQTLHAANPDRFQAPTWAEEANDAARALQVQQQHEDGKTLAMVAMRGGAHALLVDRNARRTQTLADMLSAHACDYLTEIPGPNPCELLAVFLAAGLRSYSTEVKAAAEAFAERIALDYATAHELDA